LILLNLMFSQQFYCGFRSSGMCGCVAGSGFHDVAKELQRYVHWKYWKTLTLISLHPGWSEFWRLMLFIVGKFSQCFTLPSHQNNSTLLFNWKWGVSLTAFGYFHVFYICCALDIVALSNDDMYKWFLHLVCLLCPCWWPSKDWNMVDIIIVSQGNLEETRKLPVIV
jgi:hypothetical protein